MGTTFLPPQPEPEEVVFTKEEIQKVAACAERVARGVEALTPESASFILQGCGSDKLHGNYTYIDFAKVIDSLQAQHAEDVEKISRLEMQLRDAQPQKYPLLVVCGIIIQDGCVLLERRRPSGEQSKDSKWDIPGGKVEVGELPPKAITRELLEELNIKTKVESVLPGLYISTWNHPEGARHFVLAGFVCSIISGKVNETENLKWVKISDITDDLVMSPDLNMIRDVEKMAGLEKEICVGSIST